MTVSFDGRVLSIDLKDRIHEVLASGDCWPSSYEGHCRAGGEDAYQV